MYQLISIMPPVLSETEPAVLITTYDDLLKDQAAEAYARALVEAKNKEGMYVYLVKTDKVSREVREGGMAIEMMPLSQYKSGKINADDYFKMSAADDADIQI